MQNDAKCSIFEGTVKTGGILHCPKEKLQAGSTRDGASIYLHGDQVPWLGVSYSKP